MINSHFTRFLLELFYRNKFLKIVMKFFGFQENKQWI